MIAPVAVKRSDLWGGGAMEIDTHRIDRAVLALLHLRLHDGCRA